MIHERKIEVNLEDGKMEEIIVENEKIPEKPTEPEEPIQPEEPQKPIEPVQPERTEEIEEPLQPSEPEKTIEKIITQNKELPKTGDANNCYNNLLNGTTIAVFSVIVSVKELAKILYRNKIKK